MRCRNQTTMHNARREPRCLGAEDTKRAWRALIAACASCTPTAKSRIGARKTHAPQPRPRTNIEERSAMSRYHSGAEATDHREQGDPERDWNGAVPQTPW